MCKNLPAVFKDKLERFQAFARNAIEDDIGDSHIINLDEVPLAFDIPMKRSVEPKDDKAVIIKAMKKLT